MLRIEWDESAYSTQYLKISVEFQQLKYKEVDMAGKCCIVLTFVALALIFLYQLVISIIVVPVNCQCDNNTVIPDDPNVNISMSDWISGAMISSIVVFVLFCSTSRTNNDSPCWSFLLIIIFLLYHIFTITWNIIGLIIFNAFYQQACQFVEGYSSTMKLAFISCLSASSIILISIMVLIAIAYRQAKKSKQEALLNQVVEEQPPLGAANERQHIPAPPPMTDAQFQQRRNIYAHLFNRLSIN